MRTSKHPIAKRTIPATHRAIVSTMRNTQFLGAPGAASHAFGYAINPGVDFVHRILALMTAFVIVFGTYGLYDRGFGLFAIDTLGYSASAAAAFVGTKLGMASGCDPYEQGKAAISSLKITFFSLWNVGDSPHSNNLTGIQDCAH